METAEEKPAETPAEARHPAVLLTVAYDGTDFHGFAAQRDTRTVEETLRGAVRAIDPRASLPRGTSRTDSGVHAEAQMVAFDPVLRIPTRAWVLAMNQNLPDDVAVRAAREVPAGFHPRFASKGKRYRYRLTLDPVRDPLVRKRAWRVGGALDLDRMAREAERLVGTHDFAAFRAAGDPRENTTRTLTRVAVEFGASARDVSLVVEGSAFLYNMVRIIAGTLVEVGLGRRPEETVTRAIEAKKRSLTGVTAPAHGLTLEHVFLDVETPPGGAAPWPA